MDNKEDELHEIEIPSDLAKIKTGFHFPIVF